MLRKSELPVRPREPEVRIIYIHLLLIVLAPGCSSDGFASPSEQNHFPRLMGMNIGRPAFYDDPFYQKQLSRFDLVILGFWDGWSKSKKGKSERSVVQAIKSRNPSILIGQYTILNEWKEQGARYNMRQHVSAKLDREGWWLRDAQGRKVSWTSRYDAWDINITRWSKPDSAGLRYPEWLAVEDFKAYFEPVPEFDVWYFDNALSRPPVEAADWNHDGVDDNKNDPIVSAAYRAGNVMYWSTARKLAPNVLQMANTDDASSAEYRGKLSGIFMEAIMGKRWSTFERTGWQAVMQRYRSAMSNTVKPNLVGFNVHGDQNNYRLMRFGLATCLMDDGFFSFTDTNGGYGAVAWFDEFDIDLGTAKEGPQLEAWQNGVYKREFEKGVVLVNPTQTPKPVRLGVELRKFKGRQDADTNDGSIVESFLLPDHDGIILLRAK